MRLLVGKDLSELGFGARHADFADGADHIVEEIFVFGIQKRSEIGAGRGIADLPQHLCGLPSDLWVRIVQQTVQPLDNLATTHPAQHRGHLPSHLGLGIGEKHGQGNDHHRIAASGEGAGGIDAHTRVPVHERTGEPVDDLGGEILALCLGSGQRRQRPGRPSPRKRGVGVEPRQEKLPGSVVTDLRQHAETPLLEIRVLVVLQQRDHRVRGAPVAELAQRIQGLTVHFPAGGIGQFVRHAVVFQFRVAVRLQTANQRLHRRLGADP